MTELEKYLVKLIKAQGPLSIAGYMNEALGNQKHGYYMKQDPFGRGGDFTTAPEISQMFGELIGLWHAGNWLNMGSPDEVHLIELGPGRGTLMQDALRSMKIVPNLLKSIKLHLVEMSPALRREQKKNLKGYIAPQWHNRLSQALEAARGKPILFIANEFFDALPIRQFQKAERGWHERLVSLDEGERLCVGLAPVPSPDQLIPPAIHRAEKGSIAEICPMAENIVEEISEYIRSHGGAALIIDYGHDRHGTGDTLQAVKAHKYVDILSTPGDADLTAHVNFQRLKEIALGHDLQVFGPIGQGRFLQSIGIGNRAENLLKNASTTQKQDILSACHRLTDDTEMGSLFKVMALSDSGLTGIIGFED